MIATARYTRGVDALADWRDSLHSGVGPVLYPVGTGSLGQFEIGPGRVVLVGGLPGGGKTALTMQLVVDALRSTPTLRGVVANVEMTPAVLFDRQLARLSGVALNNIARRNLDASHAGRIDRAMTTLESIADRLAFVDSPFDLTNIAATADDFGGELLTLDYLQRIKPPGAHGDRRGAVDALMDFLRQFATAGCAVLAISALSRTKDKRGRSSYDADGLSLASFRESSELEYGADTCYVLSPAREDPESVTLRCLKHRHGEPKDIDLRFDRRIQRFTPLDPMPSDTERGETLGKLAAMWNRTVAADDGEGPEA